jgi:hypothetical protein
MVSNQACELENDHRWIPGSVQSRVHIVEHRDFAQGPTDLLDEVPVMSATVLGLDMILQEPYIDLRSVSDLILSDVGATIQILRLVGREYDFAADRPSRIGDCIASLDVSSWYGAVSARTFACDRKHEATTAVWRHCRLVAQYAQLVAESMEHVTPEDAYMVGLLHGIGAIPKVLGWPNGERASSVANAMRAMEETLPPFVTAALRSLDDSGASSAWRFILTAAHELAGSDPNTVELNPPI